MLTFASFALVPGCGGEDMDTDIEFGRTDEALKSSGFVPKTDGLQFVNRFTNTIADLGIDTITSSGLCGGMVYTALDYFTKGKTPPKQDYVPGAGTALRNYIYSRQEHSIFDNIEKWVELGVNPFGARNDEFFRWSIEKNNRVAQIRSAIDAGKPVPLGLKDGGGGGDHQVLAIGYELGPYDSGSGSYPQLKLAVYDPNYPGETRTFQADANARRWYDKSAPNRKWVSFFVDQKYSAKTPPAANPIKKGLLLTFRTGGDDLRGGNDNINIRLKFKDGSTTSFNNVNNGQRWQDHSLESVALSVSNPADVTEVRVSTTFGGGIGGDNWNLDELTVQEINNYVASKSRYYNSGAPLFRFTGDAKTRDYKLGTPLPSRQQDYDKDNIADLVVFRPSSGNWFIRGTSSADRTVQFGLSTDIPVPGDYDGDKRTDIAVFRPSNGTWYSRPTAGGYDLTPVNWGLSTDRPVPGDYDGDGKNDYAVFRPSNGTWYVKFNKGGEASAQYGQATDVPAPSDYDGDGKTDFAVYRPSNGTWYVKRSSDGTQMSLQWGDPTDRPVPADYNGDGRADFGVYRPSNGRWYVKVLGSPRGTYTVERQWGVSTDRAIPGDYDGDGRADFAVFRPSTGVWHVQSVTEDVLLEDQWGLSSDVIPLAR